jgi:hypothetical protein
VLVTLANLYCTPADVADYLSAAGVQLRLDDDSRATGQVIQVTADAAAGGLALTVAPLERPLVRGTVLDWDGGGMPSLVETILTQTAVVGATQLAVMALPGPVTALATATDNGVTVAGNGRVLKAIQFATSRIKLYCCSRYDDSALATAYSVNRWAQVLAGRWLCKRRAQPAPSGVESDFKEAMEELKWVRMAFLNIEDIGTRTAGWPFLSNITVDHRYEVACNRVEQTISEGTPTQYGQYTDWTSLWFFEV